MTKNAQIIFYLIVAGIFGNLIFMLFSQMTTASNVSGEPESTVGGWYFTVAFVGNILLSIASIYSFVMYRNKFPLITNVCYVAMVLIITLVSINDFGLYAKQPSFGYSAKGVGTWINFGLLYFVAEEAFTTQIFKFFRTMCYLTIFFNVVRLGMLGTITSRGDTLGAFSQTTIYLIWVYPFFFFDDTDKTSVAKAIKYGMMLLITFFVFAIASRSYLLIMIIFLLIKLRRDLKQVKNAMVIVVLAGMCMIVGYLLIANIQNIGTIKSILNIFSGRIDDDTRSSQLKQFLEQYNFDKILTGSGPTATWNWFTQKQPKYEWLDNQFILLTWWFGIFTCLIYLIYLAYPLFRKNTFDNRIITNAKIMLFFWILACAGFAIYVTFSTKLYYYFITFLVGVATLNVRELTILSVKTRPRPAI